MSQLARAPQSKPLPPGAPEIVAALRKRLRPQIFGGAFVCSLDWELGRCWPRFVVPRNANPDGYDLRFVRGLELLVIYRPWHPQSHVDAVAAALRQNGARIVSPIALPHVVP